MRRHAAWLSGDAERLRKEYGSGNTHGPSPTDQARGVVPITRLGTFWGQRGVADPLGQSAIQMHVPLAGDIAATSADLLFSEPPTIEIPEASADAGDAVADDADEAEKQRAAAAGQTRSDAIAAQERLEVLVEESGVVNTLVEGAELASALGGAYLRPVWDREIAQRPMLSVIGADEAVPEFRFGVLRSVTFWREVRRDDGKIWRHLECYEPDGTVLHGLFETRDENRLGKKIGLDADPSTKGLGDVVQPESWPTGWGPMVRYVPNMRPNRRHRTPDGRSDLQGIEHLLDALDRTWTSWMRDIRLGAGRVLVAREFLEGVPGDPNSGRWFNVDREVFTPLDMQPGKYAGTDANSGIEVVQFKIRTEDHANAAMAIVREAVSKAGYAPQTFIPQFEGNAESGTALRIREGKSLRTRGKKERYWRPPIADVLEMMLHLDRTVFGNSTPVMRAQVALGDPASEGIGELADTISKLRTAQAISVKTAVAMAHPDWSSDAVEAEAAQILAQDSLSMGTLLPGEAEG